MSISLNNNSSSVGGMVEILRQRYFIDHSAEAKKFVTEEYTLMSKGKNITNIFLKVPYFLPNLIVFDSDGEELPVLPNSHTRILIDTMIDEYTDKNQEEMVIELKKLQDELRQHKFFLIWIKLPDRKKLTDNEVRIINLEYNSALEEVGKYIHLTVTSPEDYSVFYIIKYPEDHDLDTQIILSFTHEDGPTVSRWKDPTQNLMYYTPTSDSISITPRPNVTNDLMLIYSFKPQPKIVIFPKIIIGLLSLFAVGLIVFNTCEVIPGCVNFNSFSQILNKEVEISMGIIAASFVLPGLIHNAEIRHNLKWAFFIPIFLTVIALLIGS